MRKVSYSWNPNKFANREEFLCLSHEDRALFRGLLDAIWLSDSQYKVELDSDVISGVMNISKDRAQKLIDQCISGETPLLSLELDMSTTLVYGVYEDFKKEITSFQKYSKDESVRGDRSFSSKISSLISNEEDGLNYEKSLDRFDGKFPTIRYKTHGQMFTLSDTLKSKLELITGKENIEEMLRDIFAWLKRYPEKRKGYNAMEVFLITWARNSRNEKCDTFDEIELELQKLINSNATCRANQ